MNRKKMNKAQRIDAAEKNYERRQAGTTILKHPDKVIRPHMGNGKRRTHKRDAGGK